MRQLYFSFFLCLCFSFSFGQQNKIDSLYQLLLHNSKKHNLYNIYNSIADNYYDLRVSDSVIYYRKKALVVAKNDTLKFHCYNHLSNMYYIKRNLETSIKYLDSCKFINQIIKSKRFEEDILYRLGKTQVKSGSLDEAEENLLKSLTLSLKRDSLHKNVGSTYREIARLYKLTRKRELSLIYFKKSVEIYKLHNRDRTVSSLYADISGLLIREKKYKEALLYTHKGIDLLNNLNKNIGKDIFYSRLGRLYYLMKPRDFKKSYYYLTLADSFRRNEELENIMHSKRYWFNHYQLQGKTDSATTYFNRYLKLNNSLNEKIQNNLTTDFQVKYKTEKKEKENLQLKADNVEQELLTQKANTRNWLLAFGLLALGISIFFIWRRYKYEAKAKQIISEQKDEIEQQKNLVEILQKDLHHRMKNNLSFIDLFINLAKGRFPDQIYQTNLNELQNRMHSMFDVHKQLFKKDDITSVKAKNYIDTLVDNVQKAYAKGNITIANQTDNNETILANTSFPIGLIVNEFVTNSYKYAFDDNTKGVIDIDLTSDDNQYSLSLKDNGKGLPKGFNIDDLDSFGIETIQLLTKEYGGTFDINGTDGVAMNITLPKTTA